MIANVRRERFFCFEGYLEGFRRRLNQEKKQLDGDNGTLGKSDSFKLPEIFFNKLSIKVFQKIINYFYGISRWIDGICR